LLGEIVSGVSKFSAKIDKIIGFALVFVVYSHIITSSNQKESDLMSSLTKTYPSNLSLFVILNYLSAVINVKNPVRKLDWISVFHLFVPIVLSVYVFNQSLFWHNFYILFPVSIHILISFFFNFNFSWRLTCHHYDSGSRRHFHLVGLVVFIFSDGKISYIAFSSLFKLYWMGNTTREVKVINWRLNCHHFDIWSWRHILLVELVYAETWWPLLKLMEVIHWLNFRFGCFLNLFRNSRLWDFLSLSRNFSIVLAQFVRRCGLCDITWTVKYRSPFILVWWDVVASLLRKAILHSHISHSLQFSC